jgi:hypothetical protein
MYELSTIVTVDEARRIGSRIANIIEWSWDTMAKFYAFQFLILTMQLLWLLVLHDNNNSCIVVSGFSTKPSSPTASSDASPPSIIIHDNNGNNNNKKNVNFINWISDAPEEVKGWKSLQVEEASGKIPLKDSPLLCPRDSDSQC